ncbi:MBG domain-containing protein, partial [Xanthobacteraceae bacterium A53D]
MPIQIVAFERAQPAGATRAAKPLPLHGKPGLRRTALGLLASTAVLSASLPVLAQQTMPTGGRVVSGQAAIGTPSAGHMVINQSSRNAIINWQGFSVGNGQSVRFENGSGATLNRVTGFSRSQIDGSLSASGSLYLVNPNGITVGPGGTVTTGGSFVASTHDISDAVFNAGGDLTFSGTSAASVINYGTIGALGGDVALIARRIENAGTITAPNGTVGLAAGYEVLVRDGALSDGKFVVRVGGGDTEAKTSGVIKAAEVELRANGGNVYALAGNTQSLTKATGVASKGGRIFLTAGDGGTVTASQKVVARAAPAVGKAKGGEIRVSGGTANVSGTLDAAGSSAKGGTIIVTAREIELAGGAALDASGATGGLILVGGDYQGGAGKTRYLGESLANAQTTKVAQGATIRADGTAGAGGKVVVWSDKATSFAGTISARGAGSASGGDAEVSGKAWLDYRGTADLRSERGRFGNLLLDPYNLTISNAVSSGMDGFNANADDSVLNVATLTNALANANVVLTTGSPGNAGTQAGNITVASAIRWSGNTTLTLAADGNIKIAADIAASGASAGLVLQYGTGGSYRLAGGRVTLSGAGASLQIGEVGALQTYTLIHSMTQLAAMGSSGHYALASDLDASGTVYTNAVLGTFGGTFAGLGHTVSNLNINSSGSYLGLFGHLSGATVRDIGLVNAKVLATGSSQNYGAVLAGLASGGASISNVYAYGAVIGPFFGHIGGLVGLLDGASIDQSYASVAVTGQTWVGGMAGVVRDGGSITNSYANGTVVASVARTPLGGLVGWLFNGSLVDVYASGQVTGVGSEHVGGLVGSADGANTITNAHAGLSNAEAFTQSRYTGFDFDNVWFMVEGSTRPFLRMEHATTITNAHQLQLMAMDMNASYTLGANIDLAVVRQADNLWNTATGFSPIGGAPNYFTGRFDGAGHTLSNFYINRPGTDNVGLFGDIQYADIRDISLVSAAVTGRANVGALVGNTYGSTITNAHVTGTVTGNGNHVGGLVGSAQLDSIHRSSATTTVTSTGDSVGGLVGSLMGIAGSPGSITSSYAGGTVTGGERTGGLVGWLDQAEVSGVYSTARVNGTTFVGGLVGLFNNASSIEDAYATGAVTASVSMVGGLVGSAQDSTITNTLATGVVTAGDIAGGLLGATNNTVITGSFWNTQTSNTSIGVGTGPATGVTGLTTAGMRTLSTFTDAGWDIDNAGGTGKVWRIYDGQTGPLLRSFMTGLTVTGGTGTKVYDGTATSTNVGTLTYSATRDAGLISGTASYTSSSANADSYSGAGLTLSGLYSGQNGYDLTFVSGSLSITQRAITVTAAAQNRIYGNANPALTYTVGGSGLVSGDTLAGALATTATSQSDVGTYGITQGSLGNANYAISYTPADLTITPRALVVTANAQSRIYGNANPTSGGATGDDLVNGDTITGVTLSTNATTASDVGTYDLTASTVTGSGLSNYTVSYATRTGGLEITRRALTITADAQSRIYGNANPMSGGATGDNLVNGDTITSVTLGSNATTASGVGSYNLTASAADGSGLSNYDITYATRTGGLSVTRRAITVTANAQSRIYGNANPMSGGATGDDLVNGDTITSVTLGTDATTASGVGSYNLTASEADGTGLSNYDITYATNTGGLSVTRRALTITADAQTRIYGNANPTSGGATGDNLVNGDTITSVTLGSNATTASGVGSYDLTSSGADGTGLSNYDITYATRTGGLEITRRALTITANAQNRVYGNANPMSGGATGDNLVNSDTITSVTLGTDATTTSGVGTYDLTSSDANGSGLSNYDITYATNTGGLSVTRRALTITADAQSRIYGNANPTSGGATGDNLLNGDTITSVTLGTNATTTSGIGTYDLTSSGADGTGLSNYDITYATRTGGLSVTPRALTITANAQTRIYGNANPMSGGATGDNLVNGDTITSVTLGTNATTTSGVGTYDLTSSGADGSGLSNYDITYATRTGGLSVTRRAITVAANAQNRVYGNANPLLTYAIGGMGLVAGDSLSGALATTATGLSNVGTYGITQGTLDNANYAISYTGADLAVTPRALVITADARSRIYGNANPTFGSATGDDLVNGDTITGVTLGTNATTASGVGTYDLTGSSATGTGLSNYDITYATRTGGLTITPRALTITADAQGRIYGNANPASGGATGDNLVNGDTITGVTLGTNATTASGVGTYDLTGSAATGTGLSNYDITYATRTDGLAVTRRALTITADAQGRIYGNANPTFGSATGNDLVNGDTITGVMLGTNATTASGVGTYDLTGSSATGTGLSNYD